MNEAEIWALEQAKIQAAKEEEERRERERREHNERYERTISKVNSLSSQIDRLNQKIENLKSVTYSNLRIDSLCFHEEDLNNMSNTLNSASSTLSGSIVSSCRHEMY